MKKLKGSATLEVTFVMPISLAVVFFIIYLSLYFHDMRILRGGAIELCHIIEIKEEVGENDRNNIIETYKNDILDKRLLYIKDYNISHSYNNNKIMIEGTYSDRFYFPLMKLIGGSFNGEYVFEEEIEVTDREFILRTYNSIKDNKLINRKDENESSN